MKWKLIVSTLVIVVVPVCAQAQTPQAAPQAPEVPQAVPKVPKVPKTPKAPKASQSPKASKPAKDSKGSKELTKEADVQKVVKAISGDRVKMGTYCDIGKLGDQIQAAEQKNDMQKIDELNQKMNELATKLGPEYVALMGELENIDPSSQESQDINLALAGLDKQCAQSRN
jgi:flagellar motility protein MotE (MotC chaperone)